MLPTFLRRLLFDDYWRRSEHRQKASNIKGSAMLD